MTQTLTTTEELKHLASSDNANELTRRLARECLANREAQPVYQCRFFTTDVDGKQIGEWQDMDKGFYDQYDPYCRRILYTAPPAPAVPDDYQHLKNVRELYHKQEDRLFSLAQRIKGASFDKYSHVPSQAVDVLEREIFGEDGDACRDAMLAQPVNQGGKLSGNVRETLTLALQAMEFMGDTLNNIDAVCTEDVEYVTPAFNAVRGLLTAAPEGGNEK
ncbi:hypothetical protein [Serratia liquefaciens]|uniref:hypothetical protein n=1 Tax=Serratia liquefaciens TaxID=614 RepID=UPI0021CA8C75|nr:hypothetical protein [Serratia liquefaciens]